MILTMLSTESTLAFDPFGDIEIVGDDLKVSTGINSTFQILIDFLKTNKRDYVFFPDYGADYDRYIGKSITTELIQDIVYRINVDINNLEILPKSSYGVYGSQTSENSIQIRIILQEDDDYTIYLDTDKVNGVTVG